jgi:Spy/CpxP family protein refolding chaperone
MTGRFRFWLILSFLLVFIAGGFLGFIGERFFVHRGFQSRREAPQFPSFEKWAQELNLSPEQQKAIKEIFRRGDEKMRELRNRFHSELGEIREEIKKEIDAVLTREQREKLQAMIQEHRQKREKDRAPERERYPERKRDYPR